MWHSLSGNELAWLADGHQVCLMTEAIAGVNQGKLNNREETEGALTLTFYQEAIGGENRKLKK